MTKQKKKYRLALRRSHPAVLAILTVTIIIATVALIVLYSHIDSAHDQYEAMRLQAATLVENNEELSNLIDELGSIESVIRIAMEELGLVFPDTIVFTPGE